MWCALALFCCLCLPFRLRDYPCFSGGFGYAALIVGRRAIRVEIVAQERQRADMLDNPAVIMAVDRTATDAAGGGVVGRAVFGEDGLPALL